MTMHVHPWDLTGDPKWKWYAFRILHPWCWVQNIKIAYWKWRG